MYIFLSYIWKKLTAIRQLSQPLSHIYMKKQLFILLLSFLIISKTFSQINFVSGYFITDEEDIVECLIKNTDWLNNPTAIEYKLSPDAMAQKAFIERIKEFGIYGVSKYIRATVKIDKSGNEPGKISTESNPIFHEETVFLKVMVEGSASLFIYRNADLTRFFYKTTDSPITQLIYKSFLVNHKIIQNNSFRQQILTALRCKDITQKYIENINYKQRELEKIFVTFNECTHSEYRVYNIKKQRKDFFNLSLRPGINLSNLAVVNTREHSSTRAMATEFGNDLSFRFGIESEFILPFNNGKWSVIVEPTYQYYNSEKTTLTSTIMGGVIVSQVNYQSIELPIGVRHYIFFNDQSKIYADISYIFDFNNHPNIIFSRNDGSEYHSLQIQSGRNFGVGLGYKTRNKFSIGMRYNTSREILGNYQTFSSSYNTFSMILGYTLY